MKSALGKTTEGEMFGGVWFKLSRGGKTGSRFSSVRFDDEFYRRP
jgi:hypothetical protein